MNTIVKFLSDMEFDRKIDFAIKLLRSIPQDGPIELCYSGGKDSDVILELARMSGIPFEAIYKNTTIDPPGTIAHCRENGVTIIHPKKSMFQIIEEKGWPTRRARFCCSELKEYKIHDRAIQGIRRAESSARAKRYKEPEFCRLYPHKEKVRVYLPILEWTNEDVERFIVDRHIKCAPVYYDGNGEFHVERRLGCVGCPMQSDCGKGDFKRYPGMLREWIRREKNTSTLILRQVRRRSSATHTTWPTITFSALPTSNIGKYGGGLFPDYQIDTKKFLEDYFKIDLTI